MYRFRVLVKIATVFVLTFLIIVRYAELLWDLETRTDVVTRKPQTNYSIVGASVPDFKNDTVYIDNRGEKMNSESAWGYLYNLPSTALAWKRMGFSTIAVITFDDNNIRPSARRLLLYIDETLRRINVSVVYFNVPSFKKVRLSQVLRLVAGDLEMVGPEDFVITSDSDLWPLGPSRYVIEQGKAIHITNADGGRMFKHNEKMYRMYPLSNIMMSGKYWKEVFGTNINGTHHKNTYTSTNIKPFIKKLELFTRSSNIYSHRHSGTGWYLDQEYASVVLGDYRENSSSIFQYEAHMMCQRLDYKIWEWLMKRIDTYKALCDAHMFKKHPWKDDTWKLTKLLASRLFSNDTMLFLDEYQRRFNFIMSQDE